MANKNLHHQPQVHGSSFPLGPTVYPEGVNFSIFCKNGTSVSLLFFDGKEDVEPSRVVELETAYNRSYHYWHTFVRGVQPGQLYGYCIDGAFDPAGGYRYDSEKILLDPYSKAVAVPVA